MNMNVEHCKFMKPQKVNDKHVSIIAHSGTNELIVQTPSMTIRDSTSNALELLINRSRSEHMIFYHMLSRLEHIAVMQVSDNSEEWFNKSISFKQVFSMFKSSLRTVKKLDDPYIFSSNKRKGLLGYSDKPVICILKIYGILYEMNSLKLDMEILQIKDSIPTYTIRTQPNNEQTNNDQSNNNQTSNEQTNHQTRLYSSEPIPVKQFVRPECSVPIPDLPSHLSPFPIYKEPVPIPKTPIVLVNKPLPIPTPISKEIKPIPKEIKPYS